MIDLLATYMEDLRDNLAAFNAGLMQLKKSGKKADAVNSLFRVVHTIKGNSAAIEFFDVEKVMHSMEDILHEVRQGTRELTDKLIQLLYACHDFLEDFLHQLETGRDDVQQGSGKLLEHLMAFKSESEAPTTVPTKSEQATPQQKEVDDSDPIAHFGVNLPVDTWEILYENVKRGLTAYAVSVTLRDGCQMKELRAWMALREMTNYGLLLYSVPEYAGETGTDAVNTFFEGYTVYALLLREGVSDDLEIALIDQIDVHHASAVIIEKETLIERINQQALSVKTSQENTETIPDQTDTSLADKPSTNTNVLDKPSTEAVATDKKTAVSVGDSSMIRIPVGKVDNLLDMLGEFMILNSQLVQQVETSIQKNTEITNTLSRSAKIIRSIQDLSMSLRLIEIKNTLFRLNRIARDTAEELGKKVHVSISGEETEIDRSAAEKLFDPLMHLVRNAVSHGIETPVEREAVGKNPEGLLEIKAYSKRGQVYIEVNDDGKGMHPEKILAKAIKLGLASETETYSAEDIIKLIFKPGFSTQEQVNTISGRGVGMNVVEAELMKIGGKIDINNRPGVGCSFILRIPMNLALINGTIVEIAGGRYIVPTLFIREFYILSGELLSMQGFKRALRLRDKVIPVLPDHIAFGTAKAPQQVKEIIILEMEHKLLALPVDRILGRQEIVSKPLGSDFASVDIVSGASILGDGQVSLILDVEALFKLAGM